MQFSTPLFLFGFLPIVLLLTGLLPRRLANPVLLFTSLFFYYFGEQWVVLAMLASIAGNWLLGLQLSRHPESARVRRLCVGGAVVFNLGMLGYFKYANFFVENLNELFVRMEVEPWEFARVALPIGISFFSFQAMSYVIDVARGDAPPQKNPGDFALYIALFPQLIAGPIVRYADIAPQLKERSVRLEDFAEGVRRFLIGLGKKVLLANTAAEASDALFALPTDELTTSMAWLATLCYTLQIYFDFSGYSDMAIGLGRMFGFRFRENFDYPYIARSITDFWRRWHLSLSSWFRDYLYIPLGGNRGSALKTLRNLMVVFLLCGLWHGAEWTFVVWGLYHGLLLVLERIGLGALLSRAPVLIRHAYTLLLVMIGWVFFRAETLGQAGEVLGVMFGLGGAAPGEQHLGLYLDALLLTGILLGVVGATPWLPRLREWLAHPRDAAQPGALRRLMPVAGALGLLVVFVGCAAFMAAGTHNPFIYFRF